MPGVARTWVRSTIMPCALWMVAAYRRAVPRELRGPAGPREFKGSLHTREYAQALELHPAVHNRITEIFNDLKQGKYYNPNSEVSLTQLE